MKKIKIAYTQEELQEILDLLENIYYDETGYLPCNTLYISNERDYQNLQKLWLSLADKMPR